MHILVSEEAAAGLLATKDGVGNNGAAVLTVANSIATPTNGITAGEQLLLLMVQHLLLMEGRQGRQNPRLSNLQHLK